METLPEDLNKVRIIYFLSFFKNRNKYVNTSNLGNPFIRDPSIDIGGLNEKRFRWLGRPNF